MGRENTTLCCELNTKKICPLVECDLIENKGLSTCIVMHLLMTGMHSEECAIRQFCNCANIPKCTGPNQDDTAHNNLGYLVYHHDRCGPPWTEISLWGGGHDCN